jgi:uncharacterized protein (DUF433 family)
MNLPDFLTRGTLGEIRLTGHRIDLLHVVDLYHEGYRPEGIAEEFDMPPEFIRKVLAFYHENRADVDAYVAHCHEEMDRFYANHKPGPGALRLRRLMERIKQADAERGSDPEWTALSIVDKARRLESEIPPEIP